MAAVARVVNTAAMTLLKQSEGCRLNAYLDMAGVWTIGWGHTGPNILPGLVWTQAAADAALAQDVAAVAEEVSAQFSPALALNDNQFGALVVFAYNIGVHAFAGSTACGRVRIGDFARVPSAMRMWCRVRDAKTGRLVPSPGLRARREREVALWSTPVTPANDH